MHPSEVRKRGGWDHCPNRAGWKAWDLTDLTPRVMSCGSNSCPYCLVSNVWRFGVAMAHSRPSRYAVLTGLPTDDWQTNRAIVNRLWQILERGQGGTSYVLRAWYCIEKNPELTGFHVNVWWWGPDVPQAFLSEAWVRAGGGPVVDARRYKSRAEVRYGMKEALDYGMKEALDSADETRRWGLTEKQAAYLARNGGHLMNARRGRCAPWRDGTVDTGGTGRPLSGLRETLAAYWGSRGLESRTCVVTDRSGGLPGSTDLPNSHPASGTLPVPTGTWERAAPGRSEWSWAPGPSSRNLDVSTLF